MRKGIIIFLGLVLSLALVVGACAPKAPTAATPADFYKANTVTMICPYSAGGGTDFAARIFASFWTEVTGGPMVVKNVTGAGGLTGNNEIFEAKPDGLTIGVTILGANIIGPALFKGAGLRFEPLGFAYIGNFASEPYALSMGTKTPYKSMEDLQKAQGLKFGATGKMAGFDAGEMVVAEAFNLKGAKITTGYGGSTEVSLAIARGEVDGFVAEVSVISREMAKGQISAPLVVLDNKRTDYFANTPALPEIAKMSPEAEKLFKFYIPVFLGGKVYIAPGGISPDKVQFLRDAFDKVMANAAFMQQAKLQWPVWTKPVKGADIAALVKEAMAFPQADIDTFNQKLESYFK